MHHTRRFLAREGNGSLNLAIDRIEADPRCMEALKISDLPYECNDKTAPAVSKTLYAKGTVS